MIELPKTARMEDFQAYIHELEKMHGWLEVDLVHNCFLMGEEVGELFKAIRKHLKLFNQSGSELSDGDKAREDVEEELVDVLNYVLAIANRLDVDLEQAFRKKNARNQQRSWE